MIIHSQYAKRNIVEVFTEAFMDDDAYISMFPEVKRRRRVLKGFMAAYLTMLQSSCHLWSQNGCYALIYDPEKEANKFKGYMDYYLGFLRGYDCILSEGLGGYNNLLRKILYEGSDWLDELDNYIHLDMLVVKPEDKGKGYGKAMMQYIIGEAEKRKKLLTLETQTENNMEMYKYFGFQVYKTIDHGNYIEYCMIKDYKK